MEDLLVPGKHYIVLADDYHDVVEKFEWALNHPEDCKRIASEASRWIRQFSNRTVEKHLQMDVIRRYLNITAGRIPSPVYQIFSKEGSGHDQKQSSRIR
jgi:hypothetical protein